MPAQALQLSRDGDITLRIGEIALANKEEEGFRAGRFLRGRIKVFRFHDGVGMAA
jgi:hypothetical protein